MRWIGFGNSLLSVKFVFISIELGWEDAPGWSMLRAREKFTTMAVLDVQVVGTCSQVGGLPTTNRAGMLLSIVVDFFIGLLPGVGDIADAFFKANTRNVDLLQTYINEKSRSITSQVKPIVLVAKVPRKY
jgi:hypothetical protein